MGQSTTPELRTPEEWELEPERDRVVIDRDGWRYGVEAYPDPKSWYEPVTLDEYVHRAAMSTTMPRL